MDFSLVVLFEAVALRAMVLRTELIKESFVERPGVTVHILLRLLWRRRLRLRPLGWHGSILRRVRLDGVRDVDCERGVGRGSNGFGVFLVRVAGAILAMKDLGLEFLEVGALLRHGGQQQGEEGDGGKKEGKGSRILPLMIPRRLVFYLRIRADLHAQTRRVSVTFPRDVILLQVDFFWQEGNLLCTGEAPHTITHLATHVL